MVFQSLMSMMAARKNIAIRTGANIKRRQFVWADMIQEGLDSHYHSEAGSIEQFLELFI